MLQIFDWGDIILVRCKCVNIYFSLLGVTEFGR